MTCKKTFIPNTHVSTTSTTVKMTRVLLALRSRHFCLPFASSTIFAPRYVCLPTTSAPWQNYESVEKLSVLHPLLTSANNWYSFPPPPCAALKHLTHGGSRSLCIINCEVSENTPYVPFFSAAIVHKMLPCLLIVCFTLVSPKVVSRRHNILCLILFCIFLRYSSHSNFIE